jgi:hypothetical protein
MQIGSENSSQCSMTTSNIWYLYHTISNFLLNEHVKVLSAQILASIFLGKTCQNHVIKLIDHKIT